MKIFRKIIYISIGFFDSLFYRNNKIVVVCYHSISDTGWKFSNSLTDFKKHMGYLSSKYSFVTVEDIYNHVSKKKLLVNNSCCITFDDGYKDIESVVEVCQAFNIKPTVFILSDPDNANRIELGTDQELLSNSDIKYLISKGWIIGGHTKRHDILTKIPAHLITESLRRPKNIKYLAYPKGKYSDSVISYVKSSGYKMAFTASDGDVSNTTDLFKVPRILVDGTHSFLEFKSLFHPSVSKLRRYLLENLNNA